MKQHYGEEGGWSIPNKRKLDFIANSIAQLRNGKILDLGCGVGNNTAKFKKLGFDVEGMDIDPKKIGIAREKHPETSFFLHGEKLLPQKKYDAIIAIDVIEHVKDYGEWLQGSANALKDNGRLVLSTPNVMGANSYFRLLLGDAKVFGISDDPETRDHVRFFSKATLRKAIEENELRVVAIRTFSQNNNLFGRITELFNKAGAIVAVCEKA